MRHLLARSLRLRLIAAFVSVALGALLFNTLFAVVAGRGLLLQLVRENLEYRAHTVLDIVHSFLVHCSEELEHWSGLEVLDDLLIADRALRIENLLLGLMKDHPGDYRELSIIDREGIVIASSNLHEIGTRSEIRPASTGPSHHMELRERPVAGGSGTNLVLVEPIHSRLTAEPIGWFLAEIEWQQVEEILDLVELGEPGRKPSRFALLLDEQNRVIAGAENADDGVAEILDDPTFSARAGVSTRKLGGSGSFLIAQHAATPYEQPLSLQLRVVVFWRTQNAYAAIRGFLLAVFGSAVLGLALAGFVSLRIARSLNRPLQSLTEGTARLAEGDLSYRVDEGSQDELGHLARSFNQMAARLEDAMRSIEAATARWRALVSHAPDVIVTVSTSGTILSANRGLGPEQTAEELEGSDVQALVSARHVDALRDALQETFAGRSPRAIEVEAAGHGTWYSVRIGPVRQAGQVSAATVILTDITERKQLEREILQVAEDERERIGLELHDGVGQILTGNALLAGGLKRRLASTSAGESREAERIEEHTRRAIRQIRDLVKGLTPIGIESTGLRGALEDLAHVVSQVSSVSCRIEGTIGEPGTDLSTSTHLFRIAQEAVTNALRHSGANTVCITLYHGPDRTGLTVRDDGTGIERQQQTGMGLGLRLMKHRADVIGASFDIRPHEDGGTIVSCWLQA